jgi:hypothetical protein
MTRQLHLAVVALKRKPASRGARALRVSSIAGWFSRLPSPVFAAGSVGPPICHRAHAAAPALLAVLGEDAGTAIHGGG